MVEAFVLTRTEVGRAGSVAAALTGRSGVRSAEFGSGAPR